jgi:hypothetical protein
MENRVKQLETGGLKLMQTLGLRTESGLVGVTITSTEPTVLFTKATNLKVQGAPFYASIRVPPGKYRLSSYVKAGNARSGFTFNVEGVKEEKTGKRISYTIQNNTSRPINRRVRVIAKQVVFNIRSETSGKTSSTVGPTKLCA